MKNIFLKIAYDGTDFAGWQKQPGKRTVQGELERVLSDLCKQKIKVNGTSRTDAGVHAYGQCVTFSMDCGIPIENIPRAANHLLMAGKGRIGIVSDLKILSAIEVPERFHARFSAKGKRYLYRIRNTETEDIFQRNTCYQVAKPLSEERMNQGASYIKGSHDFRCFMSAGNQAKENTVRTIYDISVTREKEWLTLSISGSAFLYNMVRIIAGTLVEVGYGKREPEEVERIILSKQRNLAGHTAPAQGLYLQEVFYQVEEMKRNCEEAEKTDEN